MSRMPPYILPELSQQHQEDSHAAARYAAMPASPLRLTADTPRKYIKWLMIDDDDKRRAIMRHFGIFA